jgi:predicted ferric reductase
MHPIAIHFAASTTQVVAQRLDASWTWYIVRGAGFVAAGLIVLLMLSGIMQVTGLIYRFIEPITAWAIHKALAIALCVSIATHIGFLLIDHYVRFSLVQVLVPLESRYSNGTSFLGVALGSLAVSMGILAMYGVAIIVASSLGWIDTKKRTWKSLHYLSYVVAVLIFLHALYTGSDLKYGLFRLAWIGIGGVVITGILSRLWRAGVIRKKPVVTSEDPAGPPSH